MGASVKIMYVLPGKLTDTLAALQQTVLERLSMRDAHDERAFSICNELKQVIKNKEYLQEIQTEFIENEPKPLGYSPTALAQFKKALSSSSDIL